MLEPQQVNLALRRIATITFLNFAARGLILPFINIYLAETGFSGTQIGFLLSLSALLQLVSAPILIMLADRTGKHRQLYYTLVMSNITGLIGLAANLNPVWLTGSLIVRDLSDTPSASLLSQLTITWLDQQKRAVYGRIRAWGSFGWAVTTLLTGRIIAVGGYPLLFILAAICNLILIPLVQILPVRISEHYKERESVRRPTVYYVLMAGIFLFYVGASAVNAFVFIYFKESLNASNTMIGIISSVAALSEIPSMILFDRLLRRTNIRNTLFIGMLGQAALWFIYTLLVGPTLLIPIMMIRGTFYTFHNVSSTLLVSRISNPINAATNQAVAQVTIPSLAVLLTGSISGWLFDHAGPHALFRVAALMVLLSVGLLMLARRQLEARDQEMALLRAQAAA